MNFTDAVRELAEGRCEGIKRNITHAFMLKPYFCDSKVEGVDMGSTAIEHLLADDWELVGEKPQMEDVHIVRWLHKVEDRLMPEGFIPKDELGFVKLAGIDQRPVPRKVKQRKLLDRHSPNSCWYIREGGYTVKVPTDRPVYVEWEEEAPK